MLAAADLAVSAQVATELNDIQLILLASLTVGFASTVLRRSAERTRRAVASEAASDERERLSREVHDGVLQALALVSRRSADPLAPGPRSPPAQEVALRRLVASPALTAPGEADLLPLLPAGVSIAAPAGPCCCRLTWRRAGRRGRCGGGQRADARRRAAAWLLVEDEAAAVTVSRA